MFNLPYLTDLEVFHVQMVIDQLELALPADNIYLESDVLLFQMKMLIVSYIYFQVTSLCWKEGSSKSGLAGMKEVSESKLKGVNYLVVK